MHATLSHDGCEQKSTAGQCLMASAHRASFAQRWREMAGGGRVQWTCCSHGSIPGPLTASRQRCSHCLHAWCLPCLVIRWCAHSHHSPPPSPPAAEVALNTLCHPPLLLCCHPLLLYAPLPPRVPSPPACSPWDASTCPPPASCCSPTTGSGATRSSTPPQA